MAEHRLWAIPEIFSDIVQKQDPKDRIRMLRVCHRLWAVVVPMVWRSIDLQILAQIYDLSSHETKFKIPPNAPEEATISRLQAYVVSVKSCKYFYPLEVFDGLADYMVARGVITALLPNVTSVDLSIHPEGEGLCEGNLLRCLTRGPVDELRVESRARGSTLGPSATQALQTVPNGLRSLEVVGVSLSQAPLIQHLLEAHKGLRKLTLEVTENQVYNAWENAGKLAFLEDFVLYKGLGLMVNLQPDMGAPGFQVLRGFPALRNITLPGGVSTGQLPLFLTSITSPNLETILLSGIPGEAIRACLEGVSHLSPTSLEMRFVQPAWHPSPPLRRCTSMTRFTYVSEHAPLTDAHIESLARAMPCLQELTISHAIGQREVATLGGLQALARYCPALRTLYISVDSSQLEELPESFPYQGAAVERVDLRRTRPGDDVELMAQFIARLWPGLRSGVTSWGKGDEVQTQKWTQIWGIVHRVVTQNLGEDQ